MLDIFHLFLQTFSPTLLPSALGPRSLTGMDYIRGSFNLWLPVGFSSQKPQSRRRVSRITIIWLHPFRKAMSCQAALCTQYPL